MAEPRDRYSNVSLLLHWLIAALVVTQVLLVMGADAAGEANRALGRAYIGLHKSVGATILILTLVRIGWRVANPAIPLPAATPRWQKLLARTTHVLFYVVLLAMPLAGWAASSAVDRPVEWFGLFTLPQLPVPDSRELAGGLMDAHRAAAKLLYLLIVLHIAGALKHHLADKDGVLARMLPFLRRRTV